jgi:NAD(P)-dependent dehydrogenase (short-subunit alcohol dehydrogenase family)
MADDHLTTKAVIVTGGAQRIGAAISRGFAEAGWHVVIHCNRSFAEAAALAAALPSAEAIRCDLADGGAALAMIEGLANRLGDWRALVNSASVFRPDDAMQLDVGANWEALQVNAVTPAMMAQAYLRLARSQAGRRVIQVTDQKLANPNPDFFSYTMSKHALAATVPMLAMAADPADRVYGLAPGAILASHEQSDEEAEATHRLNLLGRRTDADEVANAALFLATGPLASGQTLFVDSGQHLLAQPRDVMYLAGEERA